MFSKSVIESDAFTSMPLSSQGLYFHLAMRADNDGFVDNPKTIIRIIGANEDDLNILLAKRYILMFPSGVIVIKHWWINNWYDKKKYRPTNYQEERAMLVIKENKSYTEKKDNIDGLTIEEINNSKPTGDRQESDSHFTVQADSSTPIQNRIEENRIDKNRVVVEESCALQQQDSQSDVYAEVEKIMGTTLPTSWITAIELYLQKLPRELIVYATKETISSGSNSPKYFKAICDRYILNNYKTIEDIKPFVISAKKGKKQNFPQMSRDEYNNWFKENILAKEKT